MATASFLFTARTRTPANAAFVTCVFFCTLSVNDVDAAAIPAIAASANPARPATSTIAPRGSRRARSWLVGRGIKLPSGREWSNALDASRRPSLPDLRVLFRPARHRGQDHERVAFADGRVEALEDAHVLVVQIHVDVAVQLTVGREQLRLGVGMALGEETQDFANRRAAGGELLLAPNRGTQNRWDPYGRHLPREP